MTRRVMAAVAAVVLALIAGLLVAGYVAGADARAAAGYELTRVLVVTAPILTGDSAELDVNVKVMKLPRSAVAAGAVDSTNALGDRVASMDLLPGEQVLELRFVDPGVAAGKVVDVPEELSEVTVVLTPERVLGGNLRAGDEVGLVATWEDPEPTTATILHRVLVSRVQGVTFPEETDGEPQVSGGIQVTLAVSAQNVQRVVWLAEHGTIWLSLERGTAAVDNTTPITVTGLKP
ncbi:MAG: RcpC/CpaB family pilus assembly protein [Arachnia sp.]